MAGYGAGVESAIKRNLVVIIVMFAALAAIVAAGLVVAQTVKVDKLQRQLTTGSVERSALAADVDPANRHVRLVSDDGARYVDAVTLDSGSAFLLRGNVTRASEGKAYQLWTRGSGGTIAVAIVGEQVTATAFRLPASAESLFITEEPSIGSVAPTTTPVVEGRLPVRER